MYKKKFKRDLKSLFPVNSGLFHGMFIWLTAALVTESSHVEQAKFIY